MASSSSSVPPVMEDGEYRNWAELPQELTSSILNRLGAIEILDNAQKVCTSWRRVSKDASMWRKIDMFKNIGELLITEYDLEKVCRYAVDRSQGGLLEIEISYFGTDPLLNYIADSSSNLTSLTLALCDDITNKGLIEAVLKLPLLEDLEVSYCILSAESLKVVGSSCPNLRTLKRNQVAHRHLRMECDDDALAIAETMPGLRHLQLFGNGLSNAGLNAILDNCPNLEHLDLRQCFNVDLVGGLEKQCSERIKVVKRPYDSTHDYPYDAKINFMGADYFDEFSSASDYSDYERYGINDDYNDCDHFGIYSASEYDHDVHPDYDPYGIFG